MVDTQTLVGRAQELQRAGRMVDALAAWQAVLAADPADARAHNVLGNAALNAGDLTTARTHLEAATAADPKAPPLWLNLSLVYRAQKDAKAELDALNKALVADPYFFRANLAKGQLLERTGQHKAAANAYMAALNSAPPPDEWPPAVQAPMAAARRAVDAHYHAADAHIRGFLAKAQAAHAGADTARADHAIDALLGKRRIYQPQPTLLHFPKVPAYEFYPRDLFPWLADLEAGTEAIRDEITGILQADNAGWVPYIDQGDHKPLNQFEPLNHNLDWSALFLFKDGPRVDSVCARAPRTADLLSRLPMCDVPGRGPTAFFSHLKPRTRIPAHTGVTNSRLIVHLPLIVPPGCGFRVGSETRTWQVGEAFVFDDSIEHEAWNDSSHDRVILIFDVWNPFLTDAERDIVRAAIAGIDSFYGDEVPLWEGI
jgi:aspartate beta-hydroxylase